jgi:(2Fe-2S) ferredoxin
MKTDSNEYDLHIFVCTNDKGTPNSCAPKGGQEIVEKLKKWSKTAGLKGKVRINKSGCLGRCESGVACVAYPKGEWMIEATPNDLEAIQDWVKQLGNS